MMKRTGVPRLGPEDPAPMPSQVPAQIQQPGASNMHTLAQPAQPILGAATMLSVGGGPAGVGGFARAPPRPAPAMAYMKPGAPYAAPKQQAPPRLKSPPQLFEAGGGRVSPSLAPPAAQFQRLKVEDALSYLDQVKFKFNNQPQVYNDFLDIMKEFKSQTIDTPGVITRVSNLFKGHPELIVGFNTFLPPGYKIEVQSNGQVSVSMPSPTGLGASGVLLGVHHAAQPQLVHLLPVAQQVNSAIVHNLSVSAAPANTLHHISQAHQQIEAAIHHAPGGAGTASSHPPAPPGQPVEFNHAIEYVNKIKSRFSRQPDKYKRFLEILHAYQRGHRDLKEPQMKQQTEQEVYSQVAKLFENQDDLLAEFGQFLPDAKAVTKPAPAPPAFPRDRSPPLIQPQRIEPEVERFSVSPPHAVHPAIPHAQPAQPLPKHTPVSNNSSTPPAVHHHLKRSPSFTSSSQLPAGAPPAKKPRAALAALSGRTVRDVSYAEASKLATLHDFNFFDRVRKALRSQHIYENFLRCLLLFTNEIISASELLVVTSQYLCRHPELQKWLQEMLGLSSPPHTPTNTTAGVGYSGVFAEKAPLLQYGRGALDKRYSPVGALGAQLRHERAQGDHAMDIDLSTCKRLGTSYCALPRDAANRKCSGRTALCKEVLNDTWVSFPTWSEDSTFVTSRKTQYEEYIYRCEDERFELDVVIETNASTIRVLEGVHKKLSRMSPEEAARFRLDDCLGGHSPTIHQRALRRIYGDKAVDIIAGLKKNPAVAVPVVLRRLKAKEEEWREAQKGFNKQWRELNEKYYLKSLDHQGINFKQNDLKAMRSKTLYNEVEAAYAARKPGPHLVVNYNIQNKQEGIQIMRDAAELLLHHARRQTAIQKTEKRRIKTLLRRFLPDLFSLPRIPPSDDEEDRSDYSMCELSPASSGDRESWSPNGGESEMRFLCSSSWYLFLRLHALLVQRLAQVARAAAGSAAAHHAASCACALRLKPPAPAAEPARPYAALLELVRGVLDGNTEPAAYEDAAREMLGIKAYPAYTLDKLVGGCVRQLQHCAAEPWSLRCAELCARGGMRGAHHLLRRARDLLRPEHAAFLVRVRHSPAQLSAAFTLLESGAGSSAPQHPSHPPVFLRRCAVGADPPPRSHVSANVRAHAQARKGVPSASGERERSMALRLFRRRETKNRQRAEAVGRERVRRWREWLRRRGEAES